MCLEGLCKLRMKPLRSSDFCLKFATSLAFLPSSPAGQRGRLGPNPRRAAPSRGQAGLALPLRGASGFFLQREPASALSCQTGFFKNISVFTRHELIRLQCVCGLRAGKEVVPRAPLPILSSSVSVIVGSMGLRATFTLSLPCRPAGLGCDGSRGLSPLPSGPRCPWENKSQLPATS